MSAAFGGSSRNSSELSSVRINPSCDGTSASSLTSCVCTDIRTTAVSGVTTLMPGDNTDVDTLPKKSLTPTWPAGTVRKGPPTAKSTSPSTTSTSIATAPIPRRADGSITLFCMLDPFAPLPVEARVGYRVWHSLCTTPPGGIQMASVGSLREHLVDELNDLLNAEQQLIEALPQMQQHASNRQLKAAFRSHLAQTRTHEKRVSQALKQLGEDADGKTCEAMEGLLEEGEEL